MDDRKALAELRAAGWTVAVHNDYRLKGVPHTFWLFTKDNMAVKGEGLSDEEALTECLREAALLDPAQPASLPQPAAAVPNGHVMVPIEPTPEMVTAMKNAWWGGNSTHVMKTTDAYRVLAAMLAAYPSQPAAEDVKVPAGWDIKRDQDWIAYRRPDGWTQSVTPHEPQHAHSQTLFMLLDALLATTPTTQGEQG